MRQQTLHLRFHPQAGQPTGDPPSFDVTSGPGTVTLLDGDGMHVPTVARYATHVTMVDEHTFDETGEIVFDDDTGGLLIANVGPGYMAPFEGSDMVLGAVTFSIRGTGSYGGALGLVTSNFAFRTDGSGSVEEQVGRIVSY